MEKEIVNKGSVFGGTLLISGCCIGAGMLGLPVLSAMAGFQPSLLMFIISWAYMLCTGLLLLEVNLSFKDEVNIISMAQATLGKIGKAVAWITFLFLFYCLLVAYVAGSGELLADLCQDFLGITISSQTGSLFFTILLGIILYVGTNAVDQFNRLLMFGMIASYCILIAIGLPHVDSNLLKHVNWIAAPLVIPAMIVSFGFHNLVPTLTSYLNHDVKRLRLTIFLGSIIPLFVYLIWQYLILGIVQIEGEGGFKDALDKGLMATHALKSTSGMPWVVNIAQAFAFFAIVTSFVGVALSFVDFLSDGLHIKKTALGKLILCLFVLVPPFLFSLIYPQVFLVALNYAGGIGAVILFGILPAAMAWSERYITKNTHSSIVPGGKFVLIAVFLFSIAVICLQLAQTFL